MLYVTPNSRDLSFDCLSLALFFLGAALVYSLKYSSLEFLIQFISRGLTVEIDQGEKVYLLQHAPAAYYELSRASGSQMFIGDFLASFLVVILESPIGDQETPRL
jgi:hypothetical protein